MMELQERESAWVVSLLIVAFSSQGMRKSQVLIANLGFLAPDLFHVFVR